MRNHFVNMIHEYFFLIFDIKEGTNLPFDQQKPYQVRQ